MLRFSGCTPVPLSNYLKALGVLRLVVEQKLDLNAKGFWMDDSFILATQLSPNDLVQFFLYDYKPTPLVAPWNGSTGYYPKDNKKTIDAVRKSTATRLDVYRYTVQVAQQVVEDLKLTVQPKDKEEKRRLFEHLRNNLPDETVIWLDACAVITADNLKFPPMTGTGGNDGNFEFSRTFMQQLQELMDFATGKPSAAAELMLRAALFDEVVPGLQFAGKIGQFNPMAAGGANAAPGYDADSRVNPWDYVFMLEGVMLFAGGVTRRYEKSEEGDFAYPFAVRPSFVGYGSAADGDEARAELWVPLWSAPTGLQELQLLFNEGRAKVGRKTARDAVDFARAISSRGVVRGIDEFIRYGFQVRNGLSYFAIPLGRFQPKLNPKVDRLVELDFWLAIFQSAASDTKAPASVRRVHRVLQTALFEFSLGKRGLLDVLIALGEVEAVLNRSLKFIEEKSIPPLPYLKSTWVKDCDDSSVEFRLALALASRGLRPRLVQVRQDKEKRDKLVWVKEYDGKTTWHNGSLIDNLIDLLQREDLEREQKEKQQAQSSDSEDKDEPLAKSNDKKSTKSQDKNLVTVALDDIVRWICGEVDDARVEAIARGLSLVKMYRRCLKKSDSLPVPAAYTLVKVTHHRPLKKELLHLVLKKSFSKDVSLPRVPALLNKLASGDCLSATELATRRLRASGFNPAIEQGIYESPEKTRRIAASLAFPISAWDVVWLLKQVCRFEKEDK